MPHPTPAAQHSPAGSGKERDLRRLTNLSAAAIALAGAVLLAVILYAAWTANTSAARREQALLENAINRGIMVTLNEQKSVAWWDDAYRAVTSSEPSLEFLDSEFGIFLSETYGHDVIILLDPQDAPAYMFAGGARRDLFTYDRYRALLSPVISEVRRSGARILRQRPDLFGADQMHYRTIGSPLDIARWTGHILAIDGKPAIVTALTVLPNVDMTLLNGTPHILVSISFLDENFLRDVGSSLLLPNLTHSDSAVAGARMVSMPLMTDDNATVGQLHWQTEHPGRPLITFVLPIVAIGVLAVALQAHSMLKRLRQTSTHLAQEEKRSRYAARHDALSGLPNRAHFAENLQSVLASLDPTGQGQCAIVAYLDVDRFKDVNDTLGHSAGDALIQEIAKRLRAHVRSGDFIARYGGDEFAILWLSADPDAPNLLARRIARALISPIDIEGQSLNVTASVGIAVAPANGVTVDEVMRHADIALYEAKNAGRNRAVVFSDHMADQVEERRTIETDLQASLAADELEIAYQPIIDCRNGAIVGVEALARWTHPVRGFVSPAVFIPIAEQAGLMPILGERILAKAMRDWHAWPHLEVSVNLSPLQFRQSDIVTMLGRLVSEHGVSASSFVLEITESVLMDAGERTRSAIDDIRRLGFGLALDDFGTGYSSLAYLCNFQFDKIKIDRSFVSGLSRSQDFRTIVQSVVSLGRGLGMQIVAEGVETLAEAQMMTEFGSSQMQGYYFAKPMPRAALEDFIRTYRPVTVAPAVLDAPAPGVAAAG
jgi:diguanylate cyclase (GGDEF)-like protein